MPNLRCIAHIAVLPFVAWLGSVGAVSTSRGHESAPIDLVLEGSFKAPLDGFGEPRPVEQVGFCGNGRFIACFCRHERFSGIGPLYLWDIKTAKLIREVETQSAKSPVVS